MIRNIFSFDVFLLAATRSAQNFPNMFLNVLVAAKLLP